MPAEEKGKFQIVLVNKEAVVSAKVHELFPRLRTEHRHMKSVDHGAKAAGYVRGKEIKLNRHLTS